MKGFTLVFLPLFIFSEIDLHRGHTLSPFLMRTGKSTRTGSLWRDPLAMAHDNPSEA